MKPSAPGWYDDLYVYIYSEEDAWIPPSGYLFDSISITVIGYSDDYEDVDLNEDFVFQEDWPSDFKESLVKTIKLPPLERIMDESYGTNGFIGDFPFSLIRHHLYREMGLPPGNIEPVLAEIKPRLSYRVARQPEAHHRPYIAFDQLL